MIRADERGMRSLSAHYHAGSRSTIATPASATKAGGKYPSGIEHYRNAWNHVAQAQCGDESSCEDDD